MPTNGIVTTAAESGAGRAQISAAGSPWLGCREGARSPGRPTLWVPGPSRRVGLLTAIALILSFALSACGGDSGSTSSTPPSTTAPVGSDATVAAPRTAHHIAAAGSGPQKRGHPSGPTAAFKTPGGDNSIQDSGSEGSSAALAQAAAALHGYLSARLAGRWTKACSYLAASAVQGLQQMVAASRPAKGLSCTKVLAALSAGMPPSVKAELAEARVGALRIKGASAFLLYHGAQRTDYFIPMAKENGRWKLAALAGSALG